MNAIGTGSTLTEGTRQLFYGEGGQFRDNVQRMLDHVPLGRPGTTDEIAVAALFLADPENSYMTGHILTVDGGWTARVCSRFLRRPPGPRPFSRVSEKRAGWKLAAPRGSANRG